MARTKQKQNSLLLVLKNQCWPSPDLQIEDKKSNFEANSGHGLTPNSQNSSVFEKNECNQAGSNWIKLDQIISNWNKNVFCIIAEMI